jgi:hypothetical protein
MTTSSRNGDVGVGSAVNPRREWRDLAHCRGVDPELFFPVAESGPSHDAQVAVAKAVCASCPVRESCLADALSGLPHGIAGGLTAAERRNLIRQGQGRVEGAVRADWLRQAEEVARVAPRAAVIRAGRAALAAGRAQRAVAREYRVTLRTVERWAALNRLSAATGAETQSRVRGVS